MAENNNFITKQGAVELKSELEHLINVKRPEVTERIKDARSEGDLSENADYSAAREEQSLLEGRIQEIEKILASATIIDEKNKKKSSTVGIGSNVTLTFLDHTGQEKEEMKVKIVGSIESNPFEGYISNECPLAAAILKHKVGDIVEVSNVVDPYKIKITKIEA